LPALRNLAILPTGNWSPAFELLDVAFFAAPAPIALPRPAISFFSTPDDDDETAWSGGDEGKKGCVRLACVRVATRDGEMWRGG
jgi:hypothetical protein